jgi:hypothetical protein
MDTYLYIYVSTYAYIGGSISRGCIGSLPVQNFENVAAKSTKLLPKNAQKLPNIDARNFNVNLPKFIPVHSSGLFIVYLCNFKYLFIYVYMYS